MLSVDNICTSTSQVKAAFIIDSMYRNELTFPMARQIKVEWLTVVGNLHQKSVHIYIMSDENETRHWFVVTTDKVSNQLRAFWEIEDQFSRNPQLKIGYSNQIQALPIHQANHFMPHHTAFRISSVITKHRSIYSTCATTSHSHSSSDQIQIETTTLAKLWASLLHCRLDKCSFTANVEKWYRQFWVRIHKYGTDEIYSIPAKTRVAQFTASTPSCLELWVVAFGANLMHTTNKDMGSLCLKIHAWVDPSITCVWLSMPPYTLKPFAYFRVIKPQEKMFVNYWLNIKTDYNLADCAAIQTGVGLGVLHQGWNGPSFLFDKPEKWPQFTPATKSTKINGLVNYSIRENSILEMHPSLNWLLRSTFIWLRCTKEYWYSEIGYGIVTANINNAKRSRIRNEQERYFPIEIYSPKKGRELPTVFYSILSLKPMFDEHDIFWVHRHLKYLLFSTQHRIILPAANTFIQTNERQTHFRFLYWESQLILQAICDEFCEVETEIGNWAIHHRGYYNIVHKRTTDLLATLVQPSPPLSRMGIELAGYFDIKISNRLNTIPKEWYVVLFTCSLTKSIHLKWGADLSTQAFIKASSCGVAQSSMPNPIHSDRDTNFLGASNELPNLSYATTSKAIQAINKCAHLNTEGSLNSGQASNFGILGQKPCQSYDKKRSFEYLVSYKIRPKSEHHHCHSNHGQIVVIKEFHLPNSNPHWDASLKHSLVKMGQYIRQNCQKMIRQLTRVKMKKELTTQPCLSLIEDKSDNYERLIYEQSLIPGEDVD